MKKADILRMLMRFLKELIFGGFTGWVKIHFSQGMVSGEIEKNTKIKL